MNASSQMTGTRPPQEIRVHRILVPLDFSKDSEKALTYADSLARQFGGKMSLLHVRPPVYYGGEFGMVPNTVPVTDSGSKERERLGTLVRDRVDPALVEALLVRDGAPFDEICKAAKEIESDLIVIATHGYTGLKHVFLGSTAERVVRHAPCPVLIVRERERDFV